MRTIELISIVVPVYNVEKYLERCIRSLVNQTYKNIEIILINDGSEDNSGEICDKHKDEDSRIKVIHKKNGGLSDARNKGILLAKGKYISFVDSDDYIERDYIEFLYNMILEDKTKISICSHKVVYDNGTILNKETNQRSKLDSKMVLQKMLYSEDIDISAWAKLYSLDLFSDIKYPVGRVFEDAATTYKLINKVNEVSIGLKSKYYYIIRGNSITTSEFSINKMQLIDSTEEMCGFISQKYPELKNATNRRLMYAYLSTLSQLVKSKKKHYEEEEKITKYIKENSKPILFDKRVPKRDKIAIISLKFGLPFYRLIWNLYSKYSGRV